MNRYGSQTARLLGAVSIGGLLLLAALSASSTQPDESLSRAGTTEDLSKTGHIGISAGPLAILPEGSGSPAVAVEPPEVLQVWPRVPIVPQAAAEPVYQWAQTPAKGTWLVED